jgi:oligoendopeptidase F
MSVAPPARSAVAAADTWDLTRLFPDDAAWEAAFAAWQESFAGYAAHTGKLGESAAALKAALEFDLSVDRAGDRLGTYAILRFTEDVGEPKYQALKGRYTGAATKAAELSSFLRPELMAIPDDVMAGFLADPLLADHKLTLERLRRYKPHTLGGPEERVLAMQAEVSGTARTVFDQLLDADLTFGTIEIEPGQTRPLTHGSYAVALESPDRAVRKQAFHQYYAGFQAHANTLAACLAGSVKQDVYSARVRNYSGARALAMFPDNVPESVYDNLTQAVRAHLPAVHKYYALRQRAMGLDAIHFYDIYTPILSGVQKRTPWADAVELCIEALKPLGPAYTDALAGGLRGRWCDRFENKGKHSGAFSGGCYDSDPYILMNYKDEVFDHVFTLAHEAGHSMHSHLSHAYQPYQYSGYTIFVAEVASTFNEQLLLRHLLKQMTDKRERAYLLNREIDDMRKTLVRQTMFAEFEATTHRLAEANEPLTLDRLRIEYRALLDAYFGPGFVLDDELSLECLRIPHFYRAFYVYKYATGLAAAVALADRVMGGGSGELADYLGFLKGGSSKDPLDLLRGAGVDMASSEPVAAALRRFETLVDELATLV